MFLSFQLIKNKTYLLLQFTLSLVVYGKQLQSPLLHQAINTDNQNLKHCQIKLYLSFLCLIVLNVALRKQNKIAQPSQVLIMLLVFILLISQQSKVVDISEVMVKQHPKEVYLSLKQTCVLAF